MFFQGHVWLKLVYLDVSLSVLYVKLSFRHFPSKNPGWGFFQANKHHITYVTFNCKMLIRYEPQLGILVLVDKMQFWRNLNFKLVKFHQVFQGLRFWWDNSLTDRLLFSKYGHDLVKNVSVNAFVYVYTFSIIVFKKQILQSLQTFNCSKIYNSKRI